jgi:hypothetical protein
LSQFPVLLLALVAGSTPVLAHHSVLGFHTSRPVTVDGVVTDVVWRYPHVHVAVDADEDTGNTRRWIVEVESPTVLERLGWTKTSLRAGDRVRTTGARARDGRRLMRCDNVERRDGSPLPCYPPGQSTIDRSRPRFWSRR